MLAKQHKCKFIALSDSLYPVNLLKNREKMHYATVKKILKTTSASEIYYSTEKYLLDRLKLIGLRIYLKYVVLFHYFIVFILVHYFI